MSPEAIRALVREVIAEEIGRLKGTGGAARTTPLPTVREEAVTIRNSTELMQFVSRLIEITKDGRSRQEIEAGRWVFRLAGGGSGSDVIATGTAPSGSDRRAERVVVEQGLISERQIDRLPKQTRRLVLGKHARLTPLARDRVRQRGIEIERKE